MSPIITILAIKRASIHATYETKPTDPIYMTRILLITKTNTTSNKPELALGKPILHISQLDLSHSLADIFEKTYRKVLFESK